MSVPEKIPLCGLSRGDLEALTERLLAENAELKQAVADLRAEIAKLKGVKGRPVIRPSGMEQKTEPKAMDNKAGRRGVKRRKTERLVIDEERVIQADVPAGSRFKGYEDFVIQDLVLRPHVVRIRRERWLTPDGQTVLAPMPAGVAGHFGPELRRFVLLQYHQGQVTMPRLVSQLRAIGIVISKRQVVRLLNADTGPFVDEARAVLRAGLETAPWISVDGPSGNALRAVHRRSPPAPERLLHPARQRSLRRLHDHHLEEPAEFPGSAAGWLPRLRHQRRGLGLHAPARPGRSGHQGPGRSSRPALRR
jgi:hypothetical protein